jgi:hypothetical protein
MSYAFITAIIFALVAITHGWRIYEEWPMQIGPHSISMTASWIVLVVAALLATWGFTTIRRRSITPWPPMA